MFQINTASYFSHNRTGKDDITALQHKNYLLNAAKICFIFDTKEMDFNEKYSSSTTESRRYTSCEPPESYYNSQAANYKKFMW